MARRASIRRGPSPVKKCSQDSVSASSFGSREKAGVALAVAARRLPPAGLAMVDTLGVHARRSPQAGLCALPLLHRFVANRCRHPAEHFGGRVHVVHHEVRLGDEKANLIGLPTGRGRAVPQLTSHLGVELPKRRWAPLAARRGLGSPAPTAEPVSPSPAPPAGSAAPLPAPPAGSAAPLPAPSPATTDRDAPSPGPAPNARPGSCGQPNHEWDEHSNRAADRTADLDLSPVDGEDRLDHRPPQRPTLGVMAVIRGRGRVVGPIGRRLRAHLSSLPHRRLNSRRRTDRSRSVGLIFPA